MQTHDKLKWVYATFGLWLIVSPFLLFDGQTSLMNARIGETGGLMLSGLVALWLACLHQHGQHMLQTPWPHCPWVGLKD